MAAQVVAVAEAQGAITKFGAAAVPLFAAEKLGRKETEQWKLLWERFSDAPGIYNGVRGALDRAQPTDQFALDAEAWPAENTKREDELRAALVGLANHPPHAARQILNDLEKEHAVRRSWVWARLDEAPLALTLVHLHRLAEATRVVPTCETADEMVRWYVEAGWHADAAVLDALRKSTHLNDETALRLAIRSVYVSWLEEVALKFQDLVAKSGYTSPGGEKAAEGECLLFVDGLRFDVGQNLAVLLEKANFKVERTTRLAALPTVTPTAKPAVAPIAEQCGGAALPPDFRPNGPAGEEISPYNFGKLLDAAGYQRLKEGEPLGPASAGARGWMETGRIDSRGHEMGADLAVMLPGELSRVVALTGSLLAAGWSSVKIVTDHGWLLMPGGLAKHDLPGFLVDSRWARCAKVKGQSAPDIPTVPWRWNAGEHVIVAPGARAFKKGEAYAHGGVSLQECVTPIFRVTAATDKPSATVRIVEVRWKRLRCAVEIDQGVAGLLADVRLSAADAKSTVVAAVKEIEPDGQVSLLIKDEDLTGKAATVVVLDRTGAVVARRETRIGG